VAAARGQPSAPAAPGDRGEAPWSRRSAPQIAQEATRAAILDEIPARSIGEPVDCVGPVVMLCSEAGRYVTGVDLFVDGGMHLPGRATFIGADGRLGPS
jgi:NAD(P)-dependent dehydrogenase (short-subunit alcohol dehydrogenase family)